MPQLGRSFELSISEIELHTRKKVNLREPNACDLFAASPNDDDRLVIRGVNFGELIVNPNRSVAACSVAIGKYPLDEVTIFQTARAYHAFGIQMIFHPKAKELLEQSKTMYSNLSENGHFLATIQLASMYSSGVGVPKNATIAIKFAKKAVEQRGNSFSHFILGYHYVNDQRYSDGVEWLKRSATEGFHQALDVLIRTYSKGHALDTIGDDDLDIYKTLVASGIRDGLIVLANYFSFAKDTKQSHRKAALYGLHWLKGGSGSPTLDIRRVDPIWSSETKLEIKKLLANMNLYEGSINADLGSPDVGKAIKKLRSGNMELPQLPT